MRKRLITARGTRTQSEVAKELKISQQALSRIELGERNPSTGLLAKLSRYYDEPPETLFPDLFLLNETP